MVTLSSEPTACNAVADPVRAEVSDRAAYTSRLRAARKLIEANPIYTDAVDLEAAIEALIDKCRTFARTYQDEFAVNRLLLAHGLDPREFDNGFGTLVESADGLAWLLSSLLCGHCPSLAVPGPTKLYDDYLTDGPEVASC